MLPTAVGTVVSFVVAYASVAWLLRFVSTNRITAFVPYRVVLGLAIMVALGAGWRMAATGVVERDGEPLLVIDPAALVPATLGQAA